MLLLASGCASYPTNPPLQQVDPAVGYRLQNHINRSGTNDNVFVILAFSRGGTRAAAFSYGVLKELSKFRYRTQPERELFDPAAGAAQRIDWGRDQVFCAGHEIFSLFGNAFAELLGAAHFFDCAHSVNLTDPFFDQCIGNDPESAEAGSDCVDVQIAVR